MAGKRATEKVAEGVYRRDGRVFVRIWDPVSKKRTQHYPETNTVRAAKDLKRELELQKKRRGGRARETADSFADRWMRDYGGRRGESTRLHNSERVQAFARDFKGRRLSDISRQEARAWVIGGIVPPDLEEIARGWKDAEEAPRGLIVPSHRGNHSAVRAMFADAVRDEIDGLRTNPFAGMNLAQSEGRKRITVLTEKELGLLVKTAREVLGPDYGPKFAAMIEVAAWTCMRPGELYALKWPDVDFDAARITVREAYKSRLGKVGAPKSGEERTIVMPPAARKALHLLRSGGADDRLIFRTTRGKPYTSRVHHWYWDKVRAAFVTQLPDDHHLRRRLRERGSNGNFDFYELRHFGATYLYWTLRLPPAVVAEQMGHRDGGALVMETYGHPEKRDMLSAIDDAFAA